MAYRSFVRFWQALHPPRYAAFLKPSSPSFRHSSKQTTQTANVEQLRVNERKWTKPLMDAGWSVLPNIIIEKQAALGLDAIDMNIILHLVQYWWVPDNLPRPSVATIAEAIGVTTRTVQKRIKAMEELGLMERKERRHTKYGIDTNLYSFDGLIKAVTPFAEEKLAKKAQSQAAEKARIKSKKPKLVVDNQT